MSNFSICLLSSQSQGYAQLHSVTCLRLRRQQVFPQAYEHFRKQRQHSVARLGQQLQITFDQKREGAGWGFQTNRKTWSLRNCQIWMRVGSLQHFYKGTIHESSLFFWPQPQEMEGNLCPLQPSLVFQLFISVASSFSLPLAPRQTAKFPSVASSLKTLLLSLLMPAKQHSQCTYLTSKSSTFFTVSRQLRSIITYAYLWGQMGTCRQGELQAVRLILLPLNFFLMQPFSSGESSTQSMFSLRLGFSTSRLSASSTKSSLKSLDSLSHSLPSLYHRSKKGSDIMQYFLAPSQGYLFLNYPQISQNFQKSI